MRQAPSRKKCLPVENSLDAVASRDYLVEILAALALLSVPLGRFLQDLHLWYGQELAYIDMADALSIMPQKKNPGILMQGNRGEEPMCIV
ncbi:MAG: hypothetical protein D6736_21845 [Nitrospinota bacterium]|nr:MAG: hypothetical protein D6736_21845 [Nitrospinota bacterium]